MAASGMRRRPLSFTLCYKYGGLMPEGKLETIKEILEDHPGKANQISSGEIGRLIGIKEDATHIRVRTLIRDAIKKYGIPVGGSHKGYYMIQNEDELDNYCQNIDKRIQKMNQRKDIVVLSFKNYHK